MKTISTEFRGAVSSSRRHFLKLTATAAIGGGFMLGFDLTARSEVRDDLTTDAPFAPNAFSRIDRAGKVTFVMPVIEMGQGTYTSLPMLIAEELEVDVDRVAIEHSPPDDKVYANPLIGVQLTGGSTSIRGTYLPLRQAGATARVMLVSAAAQRWSVDPSTCRAQKSVVSHGPSSRKLGYGELVDAVDIFIGGRAGPNAKAGIKMLEDVPCADLPAVLETLIPYVTDKRIPDPAPSATPPTVPPAASASSEHATA